MTIRLEGHKVLVTGGTRGVGRGISRGLALAGADVIAGYHRAEAAAESLLSELKDTTGRHHAVAADVSSPEGVGRLLEECQARSGRLDVLVHCAGAISHQPFADLAPADWNRIMNTNLTAAYLLVQGALPLMEPGGSIVLIGSRAATVGVPMRAHYTAAKAGLIGLARSLAKELGPRGIRINVVAPGVIETERQLPVEVTERYRNLTSLGRLGRPDEVGGAVLFLASGLASYITGETIHVDGGI
ncbi:SDR family NAD(P)-dependent oxidoreductase [Amycolatopsis sp. A133]|uniref:SDR family NAD(P)-dependent oxidoreductase n=1 Tax=Amycolatopsis sp. A133 TaxID=3064472 RepID=UPI0027F5C27A|nr:SDR family NAD(P)-dependent oxidoreductase [Amycolatopsis sp. A133]MDQ7803507.1 SDR family NAD(P)-dependent oxidoreductase [Amycolatopsis sp. A133]